MRRTLPILFLFCCLLLNAQPTVSTAVPFPAAVNIDLSPMPANQVGLMVYSLNDQRVVLANNPDSTFCWASNVKLVTTAAALHYLGGGFRFETKFAYDPKTKYLYIKGAGDPSVLTEDIENIATDLHENGVTDVRRIIVDDFLYGEKGYLPLPNEPDDGDAAYIAYVAPLMLNYNTVQVDVSPAKKGQHPKVTVRTPGRYLSIVNRAKTVKGRKMAIDVNLVPGKVTDILQITGRIGASSRAVNSSYHRIFHPTAYYIRTLESFLDISPTTYIDRQYIDETAFTDTTLVQYTYSSKPLREIIRLMNLYSSNPIAEALRAYLNANSRQWLPDSLDVPTAFAYNVLGENVHITGGSGLGRDANPLTPRFMIHLLQYEKSQPDSGVDFFSSLPVYGEEGTLRATRGYDQPGVIRAKTGTLSEVTSLSGFMLDAKGRPYLFAMTLNGAPLGRGMDKTLCRNRIIGQVRDYVSMLP